MIDINEVTSVDRLRKLRDICEDDTLELLRKVKANQERLVAIKQRIAELQEKALR